MCEQEKGSVFTEATKRIETEQALRSRHDDVGDLMDGRQFGVVRTGFDHVHRVDARLADGGRRRARLQIVGMRGLRCRCAIETAVAQFHQLIAQFHSLSHDAENEQGGHHHCGDNQRRVDVVRRALRLQGTLKTALCGGVERQLSVEHVLAVFVEVQRFRAER